MANPVTRPLDERVVEEFEVLLLELDDHRIRRAGWQRIKVLLTLATLEAGDTDRGASGYRKAVALWRTSTYYDGAD